MTENPHAGQGSSVLLDIGGEIGALVIDVPAGLSGAEIELRPRPDPGGHLPHVAVVPRAAPDGRVVHSAVFYEVAEGSYELYVRPDGPVRLTAQVAGGGVTYASWPR